MKKLNFGNISKIKESLMNWILTKTILLNSEYLFIEIRSTFEFLRSIYNTFVNKFLFIHLN